MTMLNFPQQARVVAGKPLGMGVENEAAASLGLKTNLVAWWALDEASGNLLDSHTNALHLTDTNTVTSAAGVGGVGTARQFTAANSECGTLDNAAFDIVNNQSMSLVAWVYLDSLDRQAFVAHGITSDVLRFQQYIIAFNDAANGYGGTASRFFFSMTNNAGTVPKVVSADTFGPPSISTWYMIAATFNHTTDEIKISVNAGAQDTTTGVTSTGYTDAHAFAIGRPGYTNGRYTNGRIAKCGLWFDRVLTPTEITALYASGAGLTYAGLT